ncbi:MAG TPA: phosphoenolpyruvate--protein phosphotransferase [Steroidobacteraceae bacterium]|nr:phosphoenolpyruvate--protein phosphotransferase [Steroidobacteraceae bacterium]
MAPLAGWSTPLEEVPDAAFAGRLLGDGLAIDPINSTLYAPCDGEVSAVPPSGHAITIRTAAGAGILLHVGIDTVKLGGRGFTPRVRTGARVKAGDPLLDFDLDALARAAPSLMTPIILLDGAGFTIVRRKVGCTVAVGDALFDLEGTGASPAATAGAGDGALERRLVIALEYGIHARPAATLANAIKGAAADVSLTVNGRSANVRSAVALMALGVRRGDEVTLAASGAQARAALDALESALASIHESRGAPPAPRVIPQAQPARAEDGVIRGVVASRGFAVGRAVHLKRPEPRVDEEGAGVDAEKRALAAARATVKARITDLAATAQSSTHGVLTAHLAFLDDTTLIERAEVSIARGKSAGFSWRLAVNESVTALRAVDDTRMHERIDDLNDLAAQVLLALTGASTAVSLPDEAIVLADELLPSQFVALPATQLAGICVGGGGPTSHVAILAAAAGVPMIVAAGPAILAVPDGTEVVLDAEEGRLLTVPTAEQREAARIALNATRARIATALADAATECRMADGVRIEVLANVGSAADARAAMTQGAEGCGLLRTEFLFLERQDAPSEDYQHQQYQEIAYIFSGKLLVIRTLDAGGDKPIRYLPMPPEENPALGLRGIRTSLWRPELLRTQLRALLRVMPRGQCRVLLPMITEAREIREVRAILAEERASLGLAQTLALGIMIETPAAALTAATLAGEADFLSIGTNDLTQYALAMDRGHPQLASQLDALHPAVLRLIGATVDGARKHGRRVSVCGGVASDVAAAPVLIGLGVVALSAVPSKVAELKASIRPLTLEGCRALAERALEQDSAAAVRALIAGRLKAVP